MNKYVILACSDHTHQVYDIYVDTVEAWNSCEAITIFRDKYYALAKRSNTKHGATLSTKDTTFKAFPVVIDTNHPDSFLYTLVDSEQITFTNIPPNNKSY